MTKKRLADLIQEEAQKPGDSDEATQEATPEQTLEPDASLSDTELSDETTADETTAELPPVNTSTPSRAKRTNLTKAELETTLAELRDALQAAHQKENFLQQQIAGLKSDFQEQNKLVQKLQAEVEQADRVKAELEQAKKVILQLAEANSKVIQDVNTSKQQEVNTSKQADESFRFQKSGLKKIPYSSIQPNLPSSKIPDKDIGWVD